jgi:hypothetical protein
MIHVLMSQYNSIQLIANHPQHLLPEVWPTINDDIGFRALNQDRRTKAFVFQIITRTDLTVAPNNWHTLGGASA